MRLISTVMISRNAAIAKLHFAEALLSWCSGKTQLFSYHLQEQLDTAAQGYAEMKLQFCVLLGEGQHAMLMLDQKEF